MTDRVKAKAKAGFKKAKGATLSAWIDLEFQIKTGGRYDARNPDKSSEPVTEIISGLDVFNKEKYNTNDVQAGDKIYLIDGDDISDLSIVNYVSINGVKHKIVGHDSIVQDIAYNVHLRRGG